jgi:hypothetical protein
MARESRRLAFQPAARSEKVTPFSAVGQLKLFWSSQEDSKFKLIHSLLFP